jgi:hypothetical protein
VRDGSVMNRVQILTEVQRVVPMSGSIEAALGN